MQLWQTLLTTTNILFPFRDFLYILQQEEYRPSRYVKWARRFFFRRNIEKREYLVWTPRAILTCIGSVGVFLVCIVGMGVYAHGIYMLFWGGVLLLAVPVIVGGVNILLLPLFLYAHRRAHTIAQLRVRENPSMQIVLIVGSFGKTTTKHLLYELTRLHKRTQMTPGTINTTTGIAQWIQHNLHRNTEVLIIEADAYALGDIAEVMHIAPPTISVITNLGDQHMERLKDKETLNTAVGEAFSCASEQTICIAPQTVLAELTYALGKRKSISAEKAALPLLTHTPAVQQAMRLAVCATRTLGVPDTFFEQTLTQWEPPERRGTHVNLFGYECLDYSFNVTLTTATLALAHAQTFSVQQNKKLLVVVGGITEALDSVHENRALGALCAKTAQHTIVINTMFAQNLIEGIGTASHTIANDIVRLLPDSLRDFLPTEWCVLLLPELGDLYR